MLCCSPQVCFSPEFLESITRYGDSEIEKEVASLLKKLSSGWRERRKDEGVAGMVCGEGVVETGLVHRRCEGEAARESSDKSDQGSTSGEEI